VWLVLCHPGDAAALWAARQLRSRGLEPLEVVSAEALAYALRLEHRLGGGKTSVRIELGDGRRLAGDRVRGVLNRLSHLPTNHLQLVAERDREYAAQELSALCLSWLFALPGPVLNRPTPHGLPGPCLDRSEWFALAARAGLPSPPLRISSRRPDAGPVTVPRPACRVVAACGAVLGDPVPASATTPCLRLAELSEARILGIELRPYANERWAFAGASPLPDLRLGGEGLVGRLVAELSDGRAS
jgi:hypothetical protein